MTVGSTQMTPKTPDYDATAREWLAGLCAPEERKQALGKLLREAYELGRQRQREREEP